MITVSKEDYLKAILEAESEGETVISATLAHWLSVSPPAVTMALRRPDDPTPIETSGTVSPFDYPAVPALLPSTVALNPPKPAAKIFDQVIYNGPQPPMVTSYKKPAPVAKSSESDEK